MVSRAGEGARTSCATGSDVGPRHPVTGIGLRRPASDGIRHPACRPTSGSPPPAALLAMSLLARCDSQASRWRDLGRCRLSTVRPHRHAGDEHSERAQRISRRAPMEAIACPGCATSTAAKTSGSDHSARTASPIASIPPTDREARATCACFSIAGATLPAAASARWAPCWPHRRPWESSLWQAVSH